MDLPAPEVPPELPEPCLGINFARDGMKRSDWLALVAVHSDAWLWSVAYFFATKLDKEQRSVLRQLRNILIHGHVVRAVVHSFAPLTCCIVQGRPLPEIE